MDRTEQLIDLVEQYGAHNYHPLPVVLSKGQASKLWDVDGREYLDFLSCYGALNFGHQHPFLVSALKNQVDKLAVCSRAFYSEELCLFSKELADFCFLETALPMNSGVEAIESALKIARKWGYEHKGIAADEANIVTFENNFHGRTITVISFSTERDYRNGFGPFTPGFKTIPFADVNAVDAAIDANTVAVLMEPVQAEAGVIVPPAGYLAEVAKVCRHHNVLLILDEIQTGLARTGKNFCFEYENATPDLLVLGKALGGGLLPLSAVVARQTIMNVLGPGQHGSTFGGNPLACAVGRAVIHLLQEENLCERALHIGETIRVELSRAHLPVVREIRGMGALVGIELDKNAGGARQFCEQLATHGVLCKETRENVIRLAPPLIIEKHELAYGIEKVIQVLKRG